VVLVSLGEVRICGTWLLDPLKAISHRIEAYRPIGLESEIPMGPVKDNGDTFWACACTWEGVSSVSEERKRWQTAECVRTISRHPISQNFKPPRAFVTIKIESILNILLFIRDKQRGIDAQ
jgi:hypothetical protein